MSINWQELRALVSPDSGSEDKVYGVHWNALIHHGLMKGLGYIVFYYTKNGTTYYAALSGKTGEIAYGGEYNAGEVSGTNPTAVIQAALNGLTPNRTWKEKVVVLGNYEGLGQLNIPSFTVLEILGRIKAQANLNAHFIVCQNAQQIEICRGIIDPNMQQQPSGGVNTIHLNNCVDCEIHHCYIYNNRRGTQTSGGEGVCCEYSTRIDIHDNVFDTLSTTGYRSYDHIKIRLNSTQCTVRGNLLKFTYDNAYDSNAIQISTNASRNTVVGNVIYSNQSGIKMHTGHENVIMGNVIIARMSNDQGAIKLIDHSSRNVIANNFITSDSTSSPFTGIVFEGTGDSHDNVIIGNLIKLPNVANSYGIRSKMSTGSVRRTIIANNKILGGTALDYGIALNDICYDFYIVNNDLRDTALDTKMVLAGSGHVIRGNLGYTTENRGRTAVNEGQTQVTIAHGLAGTPSVVKALPEWLTTVRLASKDASNIVLEFGTAAPAGGSYVNWEAVV